MMEKRMKVVKERYTKESHNRKVMQHCRKRWKLIKDFLSERVRLRT